MEYDPDKHHRRSIRLKGYDYSQVGAYFVTICTRGHRCLFGEIQQKEMHLNDAGMMITNIWEHLNQRFPDVKRDAYTVMPNHIHGVLWLVGAPLVGALDHRDRRATTRVAPTLGEVVGAFKSITTDEYIRGVNTSGWAPFPGRLWQRNYYEHVIRNETDLNAIREYIEANPSRWEEDPENPCFIR